MRALRGVPGGGPAEHRTVTHASGYGEVLRDRALMGFLGCAVWMGFVYVGQGLLVLLFLRDQLLLGPGLILLLTTFGNLLAVPASTRWRRIADRHGSAVVMAAAGLLTAGCLVAVACLGCGHAPLLAVAAVCALLPVAESGHYVASSRGYMLRMKPELRHVTNAVWSACGAVPAGLSSVAMGFWLRGGTTAHYVTAALGYALIMLGGILVCVRLRGPIADHNQGPSSVHDPARPVGGLVRVLAYVLRPGPSVAVIELSALAHGATAPGPRQGSGNS